MLLVVFHNGTQEDVEGLSAALRENLILGQVEVFGDLVGSRLLLVNKSNRTVTVPSQAKLMPLQRHEKAALLRVDAAWP